MHAYTIELLHFYKHFSVFYLGKCDAECDSIGAGASSLVVRNCIDLFVNLYRPYAKISTAVRLGWTDCHTFVSYVHGSKIWVD